MSLVGALAASAVQAPSLVSAAPQTAMPFHVSVTDDAGRQVTLTHMPVRIASTTEGTDEILSGLVPKRDIVLVTKYSSDPTFSNIVSFVKGIPQMQGDNAEQIISRKPDLVLMASYTNQGVVNQIEQTGIPAYEFNDFNSIPDIERNIQVIGHLVGNTQGANRMVTTMNKGIHAILLAVRRHKKKLRVLDYSSYGYVAGRGTTVNDVIVDAGGINAAQSLSGWQPVTKEEIVKLNPDVIIDADNDSAYISTILNDPSFHTITAVKTRQVFAVSGADLSSVSQYVTRGVLDVAKILYPQQMAHFHF